MPQGWHGSIPGSAVLSESQTDSRARALAPLPAAVAKAPAANLHDSDKLEPYLRTLPAPQSPCQWRLEASSQTTTDAPVIAGHETAGVQSGSRLIITRRRVVGTVRVCECSTYQTAPVPADMVCLSVLGPSLSPSATGLQAASAAASASTTKAASTMGVGALYSAIPRSATCRRHFASFPWSWSTRSRSQLRRPAAAPPALQPAHREPGRPLAHPFRRAKPAEIGQAISSTELPVESRRTTLRNRHSQHTPRPKKRAGEERTQVRLPSECQDVQAQPVCKTLAAAPSSTRG